MNHDINHFGWDPKPFPLKLSEGAGFYQPITGMQRIGGKLVPTDFPTGTEVYIEWQDALKTRWDADVSGATATFNVPPEDTTKAKIPAGLPFRIRVEYPGSGPGITQPWLWFVGNVNRED